MNEIIWLVIMAALLIVEASTVAMVSLWFAAGAMAALAATLLGAKVWLQIAVFLGVSGILLAALRPFLRKFITPKITRTNAEGLVGTAGYVVEHIDNLSAEGQVKLGAVVWSARSSDGSEIPEGTLVRVDRIEGNKVFVALADIPANIT